VCSFATAFALLIAACGFFTDTNGLSGVSPAATGDGSTQPVLPDAAGTADTNDDGRDGEAGVAKLCGQHDFCDDFDDDAGVPNPRWTGSTGASAMTIDSTDWITPPHSVRFEGGGVSLEKRFEGQLKALRCEFDFREDYEGDAGFIATPVAVQFIIPNVAVIDGGANAWLLRYWVGSGINQFQEQVTFVDGGQAPYNGQALSTPVFGQWMHVTIDAAFDTGQAKLSIDSLPVASVNLSPPAAFQYAVLSLGIPYTGGVIAPTGRHFDNVVCDVTR
jgi:hypothetical protein